LHVYPVVSSSAHENALLVATGVFQYPDGGWAG